MRGRGQRWGVIAVAAAAAVLVTVSGCRNELVDVEVEENESEPETYTVSYDANGATSGTAPDEQTKIEGVDLTLSGNTGGLARTGYTYAGWNTAADGSGTDYAGGATYATDADLVLYAKWTSNQYTVTFERQGGIGGSTTVTATMGQPMPAATAPARADAEFGGYYTGLHGTGTQYYTATMESARNWDLPADTELIAYWIYVGGPGPSGGIVFYDKGEYTDRWRYLEAWTVDEDGTYQWKTSSTFTSGTSTDVGSGYENTYSAMSGTEHPAAEVVRNATHGGYEDWFLPSQDELDLMYENLHEEGAGGFASTYYWSSSEFSAGAARLQSFADGSQPAVDKGNMYRVRAARAF